MIFYEANNINGFFENFDLTKIHFSLNEVEFSLSLSLSLSNSFFSCEGNRKFTSECKYQFCLS